MTVITKLRRQWFHKQGRFPPEDVDAVLAMRRTFCQRDEETEAQWLTRLQQQNDEAIANTDNDEEMDSVAIENESD